MGASVITAKAKKFARWRTNISRFPWYCMLVAFVLDHLRGYRFGFHLHSRIHTTVLTLRFAAATPVVHMRFIHFLARIGDRTTTIGTKARQACSKENHRHDARIPMPVSYGRLPSTNGSNAAISAPLLTCRNWALRNCPGVWHLIQPTAPAGGKKVEALSNGHHANHPACPTFSTGPARPAHVYTQNLT